MALVVLLETTAKATMR